MSTAMKYVQHISGQGEKWPVYDDIGDRWRIWGRSYELPKSEYRLCDPPEEWRDVTEACEALGGEYFFVLQHQGGQITTGKGYRLRKVQCMERGMWAFIVEQKVNP